MIKIFGSIIDAWTAFLSEAFTPKSRAIRSDLISLFASTLVLMYLYLDVKWIFTRGFDLITEKTKIDAHESTKFFQFGIKIDSQYQTAVLLLTIVIVIYLGLCVKSLITRRFYDVGLSYRVSRYISATYIALIIVAFLKIILKTYNQILPDYAVSTPHFILINQDLAYIWSFLILIPMLLIPSNTIEPKKHKKKES